MNLLDLFVKIGVDDQASAKVGKLSGKIGAGLKSAANIGIAAVTAVATAVGALGVQAMNAYTDYEQLAGGVETLFGKSASIVHEYADRAYETAGMSANTYMETVTSFSASLLQSLKGDTEAAANYADMAIMDMSDNANKMGTTIESIQNAYQGFAKQNYTMLDNLKLGYGGTKEEMQRLLADAEAISGIEYDISSYADIVDAIHVIQTEMGITGTTAAEASQTISGSVSAAKAAWENLLTAVASDDMDVGEYVNRFVDTLVTAADNVLPRAEQILQGISTLISGMAPVVSEMLPQIINSFLPGLLSSAVDLVTSLLSNLVSILPSLLADGVLPIALMLVDTLLGMLPQVLDAAVQLVMALALGLAEAAPTLIPAAVDTVLALVQGLISNVGLLATAAIQLVLGLATGIIDALPVLIEQVPVLVEQLVIAIIDALPMILEAGIQIVTGLYGGIISAVPTLWSGILDIVAGIVEHLFSMDWKQIGTDLLKAIADGIIGFANKLLDSVENVFDPSTKWLDSLVKIAPTWGKDMIQGIVDGIRSMISKVRNAVKDVANTISEWLHFSRPDVGPLRDYEQWMPDFIGGMAKGIEDNKYKLRNAISGMAADMSADMTITANASGTATAGSARSVVVNVYGAQGQDEETLADIVARKLNDAVSRKDAVFA